jgi:hypothetical protein
MANTKGKIIIGVGLLAVAGVTAYVISSAIRKKKVSKRIYDQLDDTSLQGAGKNVGANEAHKFSLALDPNFWKKKSGSPMPTKLMPDRKARDNAKAIYSAIGSLWDDEDAIMGAIKKQNTQGQMSQVAYAYAHAPLNHGNLGDALEDGLKGGLIAKDRLQELNLYINSLPY